MSNILSKIFTPGAVAGIGLMLTLGACSEDSPEPIIDLEPQPETAEVPISVSLTSGWNVDIDETRAAPPSAGEGTTVIDDGIDETEGIDIVHFVVFRRKAPAQGADAPTDGSDFFYDPTNDNYAEIIGWDNGQDDALGAGHQHRVARGTLKKVYGYEYKVIAIAYSTTAPTTFKGADSLDVTDPLNVTNDSNNGVVLTKEVGDQYRFTLNTSEGTALSFKDFVADVVQYQLARDNRVATFDYKINNWGYFTAFTYNVTTNVWTSSVDTYNDRNFLTYQICQVPQLFYAKCYTVNARNEVSDVIRFSEQNLDGDEDKTLPLSGVLYRGMAKVEVRIKPVSHEYTTGIGSLQQHHSAQVTGFTLMADNVYGRTSLTDYDDFLTPSQPVERTFDLGNKADGQFTPLAHCKVEMTDSKYNNEYEVLTTYMLPGVTRLALRFRDTRGDLKDVDALIDPGMVDVVGDNGTGIISPDAHDGKFYLRRNHKYVITIHDSDKFFTSSSYKLSH